MAQNQSQILRQIRTAEINEFNSYKKLIIQTCNLSESQGQNNESIMAKLQKNSKQLIQKTLNYSKRYGYAYFFVLFTEQNNKKGQKLKSKNYFSYLIRTITNIIKIESIINPFIQQLWLSFQSIIFIIESTKQFLQTTFQGSQINYIFQELKNYTFYLNEKNKLSYKNISLQINQRTEKFMKLVMKIYDAKRKIQQQGSQSTKKQSFLEVGYQILKIYPRNIYQEIFINRCKKIVQSFVPRKQSQALLPYCCTLYFRKQSQFIKEQSKNHEHKNYHWPITLQKILKHVRKTIVGFLNLDGGIIYIGMKQNPQNVESSGIYLSQKNVVEFLQWLHQQCQFIYPKFDKQINDKMQRLYQESLQCIKNRQQQKSYQYHVNKWVSVQFLTIIDPQTDLDIHQQGQSTQYKKLYLLKIKIKPGTKAQTFHLLKQQKNGQIQCYRRDDTSVKKLSQLQFMIFYNERIQAFMNQTINEIESQWKHCPQCHFKQFCKESLV